MSNFDILIYMTKTINFFRKNDEIFKKFLGERTEDEFFNEINKIAKDNYEKTGDPTLTKKQLEEISNTNIILVNGDKTFFTYLDWRMSLN